MSVDSVSACIAVGANVHVGCGCHRVVIVDATKLAEMCRERGLNDELEALKPHLRCRACGGRPVDVVPRMDAPAPGLRDGRWRRP